MDPRPLGMHQEPAQLATMQEYTSNHPQYSILPLFKVRYKIIPEIFFEFDFNDRDGKM